MILKIFTIKDKKSNFGQLFTEQNQLVALRNFNELCNSKDTMINKYPEDYSLYEIGEYDTETGEVKGYKTLKEIASAESFAKKENN